MGSGEVCNVFACRYAYSNTPGRALLVAVSGGRGGVGVHGENDFFRVNLGRYMV